MSGNIKLVYAEAFGSVNDFIDIVEERIYPQILDLQSDFEKLTAQLDANKNCLNCKDYIFNCAGVLMCKLTGKEITLKICDDWRQL